MWLLSYIHGYLHVFIFTQATKKNLMAAFMFTLAATKIPGQEKLQKIFRGPWQRTDIQLVMDERSHWLFSVKKSSII
jgi:hypothetical protein